MNEGSISQEEIDALLSGVDVGGLGSGGGFSSSPDVDIDTATLQKFANGLTDKLAGVVKQMTQQEGVTFGSPTVEAGGRDQLLAKIPEEAVAVMADYTAGLTGDHLFVLPVELATKIVGFVNGEEISELDEMGSSVISEVISSMSGKEIDDLSATGKLPGLVTNPPEAIKQPKAMIRMPQGNFAIVTYSVNLAGVDYQMWEAIGGTVADGMAKALGGGVSAAAPVMDMGGSSAMGGMAQPSMGMGAAPQASMGMGMGAMNGMGAMGNGMAGMPQQPMGGMGMMQQPMMGMGGMGMMPQQPMMGMGGMMQPPPNVQSLQFPNFAQNMSSGEQGNINLIMDVFMEMTVELGRTKKTIKDILGLGEGTIIELDKLAGEPVDILVNHKPIAKGEVVVIDENFGVRVTEILPALEHVTSSI